MNPGLIIGAQALGGISAARNARSAAHAQQRGIQQGQIAVQGGVDRALESINAPIDASLTMNQPYSDSGIGAMANINAMLGINSGPSGAGDIKRLEREISSITKKRGAIDSEIDTINKLLANGGGWNTGGYRVGGKYEGQHRDQLSNRLASLQEKKKTLSTQLKGSQRNLRIGKRQFSIADAANQNAANSGVQPIRAFEFNADNFNEDPSYAFRQQQGLEAVNRSMAAGGFLNSGNRAMAIADYASNLASTEYGNAFNRALTQWRSQFDVLNANLSAAGIGQRATGMNVDVMNNAGLNSGNVIMQGAGQQAGLFGAGGDSRASGIMGQSNAYQDMLGQIGYLGGQAGWFDNNGQNPQQQINYDPSTPGLNGLQD